MLTKFSTFNCIYNTKQKNQKHFCESYLTCPKNTNNNDLDLLSLHNLFYCLYIAGKLAIPLQMTWIWISIART